MVKQGVGVILYNNGKVLLGNRIGQHGFGTWSFPGGHLEANESIEQCAIREVKEETGINVCLADIVRGPITKDYFADSNQNYETQFVMAKCDLGNPELREPDKFKEWKWFDFNDLPNPLFKPIETLIKTGFGDSDILEALNLNKQSYAFR